jgi:hypothetical protein
MPRRLGCPSERLRGLTHTKLRPGLRATARQRCPRRASLGYMPPAEVVADLRSNGSSARCPCMRATKVSPASCGTDRGCLLLEVPEHRRRKAARGRTPPGPTSGGGTGIEVASTRSATISGRLTNYGVTDTAGGLRGITHQSTRKHEPNVPSDDFCRGHRPRNLGSAASTGRQAETNRKPARRQSNNIGSLFGRCGMQVQAQN